MQGMGNWGHEATSCPAEHRELARDYRKSISGQFHIIQILRAAQNDEASPETFVTIAVYLPRCPTGFSSGRATSFALS
ncbi:hypothetical protein GCM10028824_35320 [Hymenobacter segetis]